MLIDRLADVLEDSGALDPFWGKLDHHEDATLGVASSARPFLVAARYASAPVSTLVIVAGEEAAQGFARDLALYIGEDEVLRFPERTDRPHLFEKADARTIAQRAEAVNCLVSGAAKVVVASARALVKALPGPDLPFYKPISFHAGAEIADMIEGATEIGDVERALVSAGYVNTHELEGPGSFIMRGGIIDIFPGNTAFPVRLDFFGDLLEEIRKIVPSTGQTISSLPSIEVYPVVEIPHTEAVRLSAHRSLERASLTNKDIREVFELLEGDVVFDGRDLILPYVTKTPTTLGAFAGPETLVSLIEPRSLFDDATHAYEDIVETMKGTSFTSEGLYMPAPAIDFGSGVRATYVSIMQVGAGVDCELPVKRSDVSKDNEAIFSKFKGWLDARYTCAFCAPNYRARKDYELEFVDRGIPIEEVDAHADGALARGVVSIVDADIPHGMVIPKARLALVSIEDTKAKARASLVRSAVDITKITFPYAPGDYVVHENFGIALFKDIVLREIDGEERDYIELDYAEGDKLFLPVEQFDKVTKYVGPEGTKPKITRLNSTEWSRAVAKARKATKKLAFDLLDVYARRAASKGHAFRVDTPWMHDMEESFPYDETPDQMAAIADVFADMRSIRPMDRLICGDVGFGKTEVALRAAFAAAQDGKQVMVLCPTTILAQQHFTNFHERFEPFGMRVDILSRFRTAQQQKSTLEDFTKGDVDVLIGTHRLLSRDVNPHDLGLVIIDEEQRFGVGHKEQLKNLRETIDVLTLSATPIPRTMQMATSGVRDMSLILTPPSDRLPVKVHVGEWDPDIVQAAIRYELARGGQVYYVSNRVRTIDDALDRVHEAAPEARVGVAHGQMSKEELEQVMEEFSAGILDVLVATTIIESGIDNPHTNTLIIEDSQRLGLAQMYQLKGRVGRSSTQAFAYFLFPEEALLTEEAQARLVALSEHQELGSGMRIAMRDLEIRGAGNIIGAEQSGNLSAVGFDLFASMLSQAVSDAREGESAKSTVKSLSDITINIPGHTYLPSDYVENIDERVLLYRKIAGAASEAEVDAIEEELRERYGPLPQPSVNLLRKARIKAFANEKRIWNISVSASKLNIDGVALSRDQLIRLKRKGARYLADKKKLIMPMRYFDGTRSDAESDLVEQIALFVHDIYNGEDALEDAQKG